MRTEPLMLVQVESNWSPNSHGRARGVQMESKPEVRKHLKIQHTSLEVIHSFTLTR